MFRIRGYVNCVHTAMISSILVFLLHLIINQPFIGSPVKYVISKDTSIFFNLKWCIIMTKLIF